MPRINADTFTSYPKGAMLSEDAKTIPTGVDFVVAKAADGYLGTGIEDPGSYVFPNWAGHVKLASDAGVLIGAHLTFRVSGNDFPIDFQNPAKDRQLQGFLYALKNKTYAFIVLNMVSVDSPAATIAALNFFGGELRKQTGKRVLLMVNKAQWEANTELGRLLVSAIGHQDYSEWSFVILGDYETQVGAAIEQPGNWTITANRNLIWESAPREYRMWGSKAQWEVFLGAKWPNAGETQPPEDEDNEENDDTQTDGEVSTAVWERIAVAEERQASALEKIAAFVQVVKDKLGW